jgi:hypothetical protein
MDFVGHHLLAEEAILNPWISGLFYKDFIVFENLLFIAHGIFITIVDINDFSKANC